MAVLASGRGTDAGWRAVFKEMLVGVRAAAFRFPVPAIFFAAAALQANLIIAEIYLFADDAQRAFAADLAIGLFSGALAALAASLSGEARGISRMASNATAVLAGCAVTLLIVFSAQLSVLQWVLFPALCGLVLIAPFIGRGDSDSFWMFSARTAFAVLLGGLALLLLAGGISAILASLTYLFGLEVPSELYQHVWAFTSLFAAPLFALGQFPDRFDERPSVAARSFMDRGMRALGDFLAAPLLIVYALILHVYALKIVIAAEMPEGQIGWLVLTYGFCLFAALLIINPFFDHARAPTRLFLRFWPFVLPVPLVLLFFALVERVGTFGFTPERYLLGLFGAVTAVVVLLQFLPRFRGDIRVILALPVFALLLGGFGPQGALGISIRSQAERFLDIVGNPPVEGKRHEEALGALSFLAGQDALARVAPEGEDVDLSSGMGYQAIARAWDLDPTRRFKGPSGFSLAYNAAPTAFALSGFDVMIPNFDLSTRDEEPESLTLPSGTELSFRLEENALLITAGEETVRFPVSKPTIEDMARIDGAKQVLKFGLGAEGREIMLLPTYLFADLQQPRLETFQGAILLKSEDW
ncbi:DUF4153 domain-containing protein [Chelativorans sp. M5D2P16]|uniref:DUF4153 domain-containing protein n=1 Tax=Chelativorans sp. M5D2P16 TaxID=3095678 RepID=UPI002ACA1AB3|nr:DUF4153 domain-containing protein [Chelativorans sp. M5D2P16]MDZ5697032.1 DUF4153 domain-containing protein [Chelativorans sp. M5D2P16]